MLQRMVQVLMLIISVVAAFGVAAKASVMPEAVLTFANRDIVTLRSSGTPSTPAQRVERIGERLRRLSEADLAKPVSKSFVTVDAQNGYLFLIGDQQIFILFEADIDRDTKTSLEHQADLVEHRLKEAIAVSLAAMSSDTLLKGLLRLLIASAVAAALLWFIQRISRRLLDRLQRKLSQAKDDLRWRWASQSWLLIFRLTQLFMAFLWLNVAYIWGMYVLGSFPLTQPFADKLSGFLFDLLHQLGSGAIAAIPGLVTVAVVLFLTKAVNDVVGNLFGNVEGGSTDIPGIHKDTAGATRRIVSVLIWGFVLWRRRPCRIFMWSTNCLSSSTGLWGVC